MSTPLGADRKRLRVIAGLAALGIGAPVVWHLADAPQPPSGKPLPIDLSRLTAGRVLSVEWEGRIVWVMRRTAEQIEALEHRESELSDPESLASLQPKSCRNRHRSLRPEIFVAIGQCTHQGCPPTLQRGHEAYAEFLCPCHTSKYDLAGRVFRDGPAPANLTIPAYHFPSDTELVIGRLG